MTPTLSTLLPDLLRPTTPAVSVPRREEPSRAFHDTLRGVQEQSQDVAAGEIDRPPAASEAPTPPEEAAEDPVEQALDAESNAATPAPEDEAPSTPQPQDPVQATEASAILAPASAGAESAVPAQTVPTAAQVLPLTTEAPVHASGSISNSAAAVESPVPAPITTTPIVGAEPTIVAAQSVSVEVAVADTAPVARSTTAPQPAAAPPPPASSNQAPATQPTSGITGSTIATSDDGQPAPQQEVAETRGGPRQQAAARVPTVATPTPATPASGRAAEVDASVRLENATGQPTSSAPGRAVPVNVAVPSQTPGQSTAPVMAAHASPVATTTPVAGMLDEETFGSRVVRGMTTVVNQRGGVMTMRLEPPELGDLRVQMTLARGLVSAQFQAATPEAHALLEKSMTMLRTALENQGLTVQRLSVHLSPGAQLGADNGGQSSADQGQHHGARHDAAGEESRGRRDDLPEHARGRDGAARRFEDHIADREDPTPSDVTVTRAGGPIQ